MAITNNHTRSRRQNSSLLTSSRTSVAHRGTSTTDVKVLVGGSIEDDAAAFVDAGHRAERGGKVRERVLAFESWEALAAALTGERYRLLHHLHQHPDRR